MPCRFEPVTYRHTDAHRNAADRLTDADRRDHEPQEREPVRLSVEVSISRAPPVIARLCRAASSLSPVAAQTVEPTGSN